MAAALVYKLEQLVPTIQDSPWDPKPIKEANILLKIIVDRQTTDDEAFRRQLVSSSLPTIFAGLVKTFMRDPPALPSIKALTGQVIVEQFVLVNTIGQAAAYIQPECLDALLAAKFPQMMMAFLTSMKNKGREMAHLQLISYSNIVAYLLDTVQHKNPKVNAALHTKENIHGLIQLANWAYTPGQWEADLLRAHIAAYIWKLACLLAEPVKFDLSAQDVHYIVSSSMKFWCSHSPKPPAQLQSLSMQQRRLAIGQDMTIASYATSLLDTAVEGAKIPQEAAKALLKTKKLTFKTLFNMAESLDWSCWSDWVDVAAWDDATCAGAHVLLDSVRCAAIKLIVYVVVHSGTVTPDWVFERITDWVESKDTKLVLAGAMFLEHTRMRVGLLEAEESS